MKIKEYLNEAGSLDGLKKTVNADSVTQTPWDSDDNPFYGKHKISQVILKFSTGMNRKQFDDAKATLQKEAKKYFPFPNVNDISIGGYFGGKTSQITLTLIKQSGG